MNAEFDHRSILLEEALNGLNIKSSGKYVDGTYGRGGHSSAILELLDSHGRLLVIDKDPQAIKAAYKTHAEDDRVIIEQGSFAMLEKLVTKHEWLGQVDGVLLDLGVSSPQFDDASCGFSFKRDGLLDMRMDPGAGQSAADWLKHVPESELADVLYKFGDERYSRRIARAIVRYRQKKEITTTVQLAQIIADAHPAWERGKDPATKCFQAIRIFINKELEDLQACLPQALDCLSNGGRLIVISFHSLEDRVVKRFIRKHSSGDPFPIDLPVTVDQLQPDLKAVGKALRAKQTEVDENPRARSAVLRVAERVMGKVK